VSSFIHNKCLCGSPLPRCKWSLVCYCMFLRNWSNNLLWNCTSCKFDWLIDQCELIVPIIVTIMYS
jgi:hypothetical protein